MASMKSASGSTTRTGPTGMPLTWWPSRPADSCRNERLTESEQVGVFVMKRLAFWIAAAAVIGGVVAVASGTSDEGRMPDLDGAVAWLNSAPLSSKALRGKVVVVNFWTYSCINSLRELPYMKAWASKYKGLGLVVIGVHAPEFGFERVP